MNKIVPITITLTTVIIAMIALAYLMSRHWLHPWTRDGQVQALVVEIASRVTGPIVELPIKNNQKVSKGDLLFKIDPRTFETNVKQHQAELEQAIVRAAEAKTESESESEYAKKIFEKDEEATSIRKVMSTEHARQAAIAAVELHEAALQSAKLDLAFTEVRAPVDGYVTNLNLQLGDQVIAEKPVIALIDSNSFWVYGFFKETQIKRIHIGDQAEVKLMAYHNVPIDGIVTSIEWGIARKDGSTGRDLLITVNPSFDWIRLAQRIPVVIHLHDIPETVMLRVGMTASVFIKEETCRGPTEKCLQTCL